MDVTGWLTANFVEQIHKAHLKKRPVDGHISGLASATLAGLVEYGCLRRSFPELPVLPHAITHSPLGRELNRIASEIGLRTEGDSEQPSISHEPREIEFVVVRDEEELLSEPVQMMFMRVTQATKRAGFTERTANEFQAAFAEMIANAIEHSACPIPIVVGYHVSPQIASFVVADVGRGVFDSLRGNPDHQDVANHAEAIRKSLQDGVSRHQEPRGNGFRPIFKAVTDNWGTLRFRSGKGCLTMDGTELAANRGILHFPPELPGFQVTVSCRSTALKRDIPVV